MKNRVLKTTIALTFLMQSFHGFAQETPPAARNPDLKVPPVINGPTNPPTTPLVPGTPVTPPAANNKGLVLPNLDKSLVPGVTCPLVDNQPDADLVKAADNLYNNISTIQNSCKDNNSAQADTKSIQASLTQISAAGDILKQYMTNPGAYSSKMDQVQTNITTLIQGITSISTTLTSNSLLNQSCAGNVANSGNLIASLSNLVQAASPIATSVLSMIPGLTPAIPFVLGISAAGNVSQVISQLKNAGTLNMDEPKTRTAVLQNICEYTRIVERVKVLRATRKGNQKFLQQYAASLSESKARLASLSQQLSSDSQSPADTDQVESVGPNDAGNSNLTLVVASQQSLDTEEHRRMVLAQSGADIESMNIDEDLLNIKSALFGQRPSVIPYIGLDVPYLQADSPVIGWYNHGAEYARKFQVSFSQEIKELREEAVSFYLPLNSIKPLVVEDYDGFMFPNIHNITMYRGSVPTQLQEAVTAANTLSPMTLANLPNGSQPQENICLRVQNALSDWQSTLDFVGGMTEYCDYIRPYMDQSFDPKIQAACQGPATSTPGSVWTDTTYPNSELSILRKQLAETSQKDVHLLRSKSNELNCDQYITATAAQ